jgi:hypothetical protein
MVGQHPSQQLLFVPNQQAGPYPAQFNIQQQQHHQPGAGANHPGQTHVNYHQNRMYFQNMNSSTQPIQQSSSSSAIPAANIGTSSSNQ